MKHSIIQACAIVIAGALIAGVMWQGQRERHFTIGNLMIVEDRWTGEISGCELQGGSGPWGTKCYVLVQK